MKRCPTCQQIYPDNVGDICPSDSTHLVYASETGTPYDNQAQWQPPPAGWNYPPPGQSSAGPAQDVGGNGLYTTAMLCGICATVFPILAIAILASVRGYGDMGLAKLGSILMFLTLIMGLTAISLGVVATSLAGRNSARRAKGILGLCLGILPFLVLLILILASDVRPRFPY